MNQRGISIIQALVIIGAMSAIGAAIATMMLNTNRQARSVSAKTDFNSLVNTIQASLNNTTGCLNAFGGAGALKLGAFPQAVSLVGAVPVAVGPYGTTLRITRLELSQLKEGVLTPPGPKTVTVEMNITVDRSVGAEAAVGGSFLTHAFDISMVVDTTDPLKPVTGCSAKTENHWVSTNESADITYMGGGVGVWGAPARPIVKNALPPLRTVNITLSAGALLDVNCSICLDPTKDGAFTGTVFKYASDRRLKENIREIPDALSKVLQLHGTMFNWKNYSKQTETKSQIGFIAQEVEKIFPDAVVTDLQTGMKSVAYENLIAPLVEAMKERQNLILRQQKEIDEIKQELLKK